MKTKASFIKNILLIILSVLFLRQEVKAQTKHRNNGQLLNIPFEPSRFDTSQRKVVFLNYKGQQAMKILPFGTRQTRPVTLKGLNFTNGTIEFDAMPIEGDYEDEIAINFHQQDTYNFESLYLRVQEDESVQRDDAIQYTPVLNSVNLWDIMTPFRGYALIHNKDWNHFKLVISGAQLLVYVNSNDKLLFQDLKEITRTAQFLLMGKRYLPIW
jgi:hypothetical protein